MNVLVIGRDDDPSTNDLISDLLFRGHRATRINGSTGNKPFTMELGSKNGIQCSFGGSDINSYDAILFRKEHNPFAFNNADRHNDDMGKLLEEIAEFQRLELRQARQVMYSLASIPAYPMMSAVASLNKMLVLKEAFDVGLKIPRTLITNSKVELLRFVRDVGQVITKPINEFYPIRWKDRAYAPYTARLTASDIDAMSDTFFPSLVQEEISKVYEVRTFFAANRCYSMAQFNADHETTELDFRRYDEDRPTRSVPYKLPLGMEQLITDLMAKLGLSTGSLDIIRSGNDYYFLEVNPVGQYGMVAHPCNYNLDRVLVEMIEDEAR